MYNKHHHEEFMSKIIPNWCPYSQWSNIQTLKWLRNADALESSSTVLNLKPINPVEFVRLHEFDESSKVFWTLVFKPSIYISSFFTSWFGLYNNIYINYWSITMSLTTITDWSYNKISPNWSMLAERERKKWHTGNTIMDPAISKLKEVKLNR